MQKATVLHLASPHSGVYSRAVGSVVKESRTDLSNLTDKNQKRTQLNMLLSPVSSTPTFPSDVDPEKFAIYRSHPADMVDIYYQVGLQ